MFADLVVDMIVNLGVGLVLDLVVDFVVDLVVDVVPDLVAEQCSGIPCDAMRAAASFCERFEGGAHSPDSRPSSRPNSTVF